MGYFLKNWEIFFSNFLVTVSGISICDIGQDQNISVINETLMCQINLKLKFSDLKTSLA